MRIRSYPMYNVDLRVKNIIDRSFPIREELKSDFIPEWPADTGLIDALSITLPKKKYNYKRASHAVIATVPNL